MSRSRLLSSYREYRVSWRSGAQLFAEIWPLLQARIPDARMRRQFLGQLLTLFLEWDVDPETVADLHPEVRQALAVLGEVVQEESTEDADVARCTEHLASPEEKVRVNTAQALEFAVHQAADPAQAAQVALLALVGALRDSSRKVRRAAAQSIDSLLAEKFTLPRRARKGLEEALTDEDPVVRKRIAKALKRLGAAGP
jgi:hypothetical protein